MDLTDDYANRPYIPGAEEYPARWAAKAAAFRDAQGPRACLDIACGAMPRQKLDLFLPEKDPAGLLVFIHGGYWHLFAKSDWSHLAAGALARGWAVAMPGYTLAPQARIAAITAETATAVEKAATLVPNVPIVITGHSAGGHLAARMRCTDVPLPSASARLARILPISPVADLRPILHTEINAELHLDPAQAVAESPVLHSDLRDVPAMVWVGAEERPAFLDQARRLADAWPETRLRIAPGRHHFDVIEELEDPGSPLMRALLDDL